MTRTYNGEQTFAVNGAKLSKIRIKAGMAMSELAAELECNKAQISRWEQGKLNPSGSRIRKMIQIFGRSDFLIPGQDFNKEG